MHLHMSVHSKLFLLHLQRLLFHKVVQLHTLDSTSASGAGSLSVIKAMILSNEGSCWKFQLSLRCTTAIKSLWKNLNFKAATVGGRLPISLWNFENRHHHNIGIDSLLQFIATISPGDPFLYRHDNFQWW